MKEIQAFDYDIFLSYRHKPLDNSICKRVHTVLETYKPPRRFKQAKIRRVFRDDDELPVAGILSDTIGEALKSTRCLLVICSPDTPESQWVDREVRTFIELGRSDKIYALLIKGTPQESFPPSLLHVHGIENRTLCVEGRNEKHVMRHVRRLILKVIAEATQTPYDSLRLSHRRRAARKAVLTAAALVLLLTASGLYSLYQWIKASYYNVYAQREELMITRVIENLTFELPEALGNIPGIKPVLVEITHDNLHYLDRMMALSSDKGEALLTKAKHYLALSKSWMEMADAEKSLFYAQEAARIYSEKEFSKPDGRYGPALINGYNAIAVVMQALGIPEDALAYSKKAEALSKGLINKDPSPENIKQLADTTICLGECYLKNEDVEEAEACFAKGLDLLETLCGEDPVVSFTELSKTYLEISSALQSAGEADLSASYLDKGISILKDGSASDKAAKADLLSAYIRKALSDINRNLPDKAIEVLEQALGLLSAENPDEEKIMAEIYSLLGTVYDMKGEFEEAGDYYAKNLAIREKYRGTKEDLEAQKSLAAGYMKSAENLKSRGALKQAAEEYKEAIDIYQWLLDDKDEYLVTSDLGACWNDMGTVYLAMDDMQKASEAFNKASDCFEMMDEAMPSLLTKTNWIVSLGNGGLCYYHQAKYSQAAPYYEKAAKVCDDMAHMACTDSNRQQMADTYNMAGLCLMNAYSFQQADSYLEKCLSLYEKLAEASTNPVFQRGYALSLYAMALNEFCMDQRDISDYHYKLSLNAMDRYVKNSGSDFEGSYYAIYSLYYLLFVPEEVAKAYEVGQMALEADPQNPFVRQLTSYSLLFTGREEEALAVFRELEATDPHLLPSLTFDFDLFRKSGLPGEGMKIILQELSPPGA